MSIFDRFRKQKQDKTADEPIRKIKPEDIRLRARHFADEVCYAAGPSAQKPLFYKILEKDTLKMAFIYSIYEADAASADPDLDEVERVAKYIHDDPEAAHTSFIGAIADLNQPTSIPLRECMDEYYSDNVTGELREAQSKMAIAYLMLWRRKMRESENETQ